MFKSFLLASALIFPTFSFAQTLDDSPPVAHCAHVTEKLNEHLVKDFDILDFFMMPIDTSAHVYLEEIIYKQKTADADGNREVFIVGTTRKDQTIINQCILGAGISNEGILNQYKKSWDDYKSKGGKMTTLTPNGVTPPSDSVPNTPAPAPNFKDDDSSND